MIDKGSNYLSLLVNIMMRNGELFRVKKNKRNWLERLKEKLFGH